MNPVHYSSATVIWATPQEFFDKYNAKFSFTTDVCALPENAKCQHFYTPEQDGLAQEWRGACWMNPPYGREIGKWVEKAAKEANDNGATVVCLLPARTDTRWWHDNVIQNAASIEFLRRRIKFGNAKSAAPFPSAVVIFKPKEGVAE